MAQKAEKKPTPINTTLDGKVAATGNHYPDEFFINPWNAKLDGQYPNENGHAPEDRTLYSPSKTIEGMGVLSLNNKSDYDSNWEHGVRGGIEEKPRGPRESTRWTPKGGKGR
ncbi:MAG: hypothetical protein ABR949_10095 [Candidatus Aquilonibacter sp.]|jgi:hypothetical protein